MHFTPWRQSAPKLALGLALPVLLSAPASAHHLMDISGLKPTAINGLLSGLAHPILGPDHLLFLLALALIGLRQRGRWMMALLTVGLLGSALGLIGPGLPGAELLVSLTLVAEALVLLAKLPAWWLVPAMALHGYVLSSTVVGWSAMPLLSYFSGLLISQGALLVLALSLLQPAAGRLKQHGRRVAAALLIGAGVVATLSQALA